MEGGQYNVDISFERTIEYDQCPVCLCELSDNISIFTLPCVHTICENCIGKMNDECPLCRTTIENNIVNLELERGQSAVTKKPEKQSNMEVCELERTSSVNTLLRCVSSSISNTVENNVKYNEIGTKKPQYIQKTVHHLHKFDKLRFEFNNKQLKILNNVVSDVFREDILESLNLCQIILLESVSIYSVLLLGFLMLEFLSCHRPLNWRIW